MISAVVLVKNQAKQLETCLASLTWCEEVIVIDDESSDNSITVAKKHDAKVYIRALNGDFASQRNFGLSKATNEWVLFIDADEVVSPELAVEIYQQATQFLSTTNGYYLKRDDILWGKKLQHGETAHLKLLRLGKNGKGKWVGKVHERWEILGETHVFQHALLHYPHQTLREFLDEINMYTTLRAKELHEKNIQATTFSLIFFPLGKFLSNYFIKLGFFDGIPGIIMALMMSFHSFLVRGKLWQLNKNKRKYDFGN